METGKKRCTAIVLAAGNGKRMKSAVAKQYMRLGGKPLLWYALNAVEQSRIIDDCILVTGADDVQYVDREIVKKYHFQKIDTITAGGAERYLSVENALHVIEDNALKVPNEDGYVFIHDGARPFLTEAILRSCYEEVQRFHACAAAMPVKDTVKIADGEGFALTTPDRRTVWSIQTPQVFDTRLILRAYQNMRRHVLETGAEELLVTDDAGVVELFTEHKVKLLQGSYSNIKITTPEDIHIAEALIQTKF